MSMSNAEPFVTYLEGLREDRGKLAALRRGLGQEPGTVISMFPIVVGRIPDDAKPWQERAYYMVAALFAYHPDAGGQGNLGDSFRQATKGEQVEAIERRFTALLAAHEDDLEMYLRQAVSFLKAKQAPINWHQLFRDIQNWGHPDRIAQKAWARAFWHRDFEFNNDSSGDQPQDTNPVEE